MHTVRILFCCALVGVFSACDDGPRPRQTAAAWDGGAGLDEPRDAPAEAYAGTEVGGWDRTGATIRGQWQEVDILQADGLAVMEGDIVLGPVDDARGTVSIQGTLASVGGWPTRTIPYAFEQEPSPENLERFLDAAAMWEEAIGGLEFVEHTDEDDYILINTEHGCASSVGYFGGEQKIWIGPACSTGSAAHELGHLFGLYHEHTRPDRDDHVVIDFDNIADGKERNFEVIESARLLGPYNLESIMHYGPTSFSRNGEPTIVPLDGAGLNMGQRIRLTETDVDAVAFAFLRRRSDPSAWTDVVAPSERLEPGARIHAAPGGFYLDFSEDGNLAVYHQGKLGDAITWQSNTAGLGVTALLVNPQTQRAELVDADGRAVWSTPSGTYGSLEISPMGILGLFKGSELVWASRY